MPRPGPALLALLLLAAPAAAAEAPWADRSLSPDARATLIERAMTRDEKLALVRGRAAFPMAPGERVPAGALGSAGFVPGVPRLGIPALQETDAGLGVANPNFIRPGDRATAMPATLAVAAGWDPALARAIGAAIGEEARAKGFNLLLGGGLDLVREPRGGRSFEYPGEDPLLAGVIAGETVAGTQGTGVISTVKHYAFNDQETLRQTIDVVIGEAAARESDLLAFELAIERGRPGAVMCAYNRVEGAPACGSAWLLDRVLKRDWGYPGFVLSDWGAVADPSFATAGLDQESAAAVDAFKADPATRPPDESAAPFFAPLARALDAGTIPAARLDDMAHRVLASMFAAGLMDPRPAAPPIDYPAHAALARRAAAEGMVLLKNERRLLPLGAGIKRIAVIGGWADLGVAAGGGSSEVMPARGSLTPVPLGGRTDFPMARRGILDPSPPLDALKAALPGAEIRLVDGSYPEEAGRAARWAEVALVFAVQWRGEGWDVPSLALPSGQDDVIRAVAAANPRTVVVVESGGPVTMPWLAGAGAVLEAWFPGEQGGEAIADVLTGARDPGGRLPVSFPASEAQLPHPDLPGRDLPLGSAATVEYSEGARVGYRWLADRQEAPLFAFGAGLSYARFEYSELAVEGGGALAASVTVRNAGDRPGEDVVQLYLERGPGGESLRLLGWQKLALGPGESQRVTITAEPRLLGSYDVAAHGWAVPAGSYRVAIGHSALDRPLAAETRLDAWRRGP